MDCFVVPPRNVTVGVVISNPNFTIPQFRFAQQLPLHKGACGQTAHLDSLPCAKGGGRTAGSAGGIVVKKYKETQRFVTVFLT